MTDPRSWRRTALRFALVGGGAILVQVHFHGLGDASVRFHSASAEARACADVADVATCGIVRTAGWMDHASLTLPPADAPDCWAAVQQDSES